MEGDDVAKKVMGGDVGIAVEFNGDGGSDFGTFGGVQDAEMIDGPFVHIADFILAIVEVELEVLPGLLRGAPVEGVVGVVGGCGGCANGDEAVEGVVEKLFSTT